MKQVITRLAATASVVALAMPLMTMGTTSAFAARCVTDVTANYDERTIGGGAHEHDVVGETDPAGAHGHLTSTIFGTPGIAFPVGDHTHDIDITVDGGEHTHTLNAGGLDQVVTGINVDYSGASDTGSSDSFACGQNANVNNSTGSSAFGPNASSFSSFFSTSTGFGAQSNASAFSTATGAFANASNSFGSTATGAGATVENSVISTATGAGADASESIASTATGALSNASHSAGSTATGAGSNVAYSIGSTATGAGANAVLSIGSTATGANASASLSILSTATGANSNAVLSFGSTATGAYSDVSGTTFATANGFGAEVSGGERGTAIGAQSLVHATNGTAIGGESSAGFNGTAVGSGAQANYSGSAAIGRDAQGNSAAATRNNEFVLGTANHSYTAAGITSDASRSFQSGPLEIATTDSNGHLATDGGQVFRTLGEQGAGIAIALALENPDLVGNEKFGLSANLGFFEGNTALGVALMGVLGQNFAGYGERWAVSGGVGVSLNENEFGNQGTDRTVAGRAGVQVSW